jgi:hypothetical protein
MLPLRVVGKQVAGNPDLLVGHLKTGPEEPDEESDHGRVRIDEFDRMATSRPFGPIEHATSGMEKIALARH